ncbi:MBL fold metallo-hydrolase [Tersicoccus sp. Bi-70]|uniref:MBL fold metallo-hydrolase n=1 Tax=Tersicoccus sp. Bi-70 TaxID=1897634 RepID=UPI0009786441|nr:MBL fold metallo-hydrolase [Tersicoccus sp. Bi-70]OMH36665.1 metal-dependent hydrolase [Tersicoccus sp. Bi-70]
MRVTIVGCAGSFPRPDSPASCYLLSAEDADGRTWNVAMDLGSGSLGALQSYIDLDQLDAVIISHAHADHYLDMVGLHVALRWNPAGWSGHPVPVYAAGMLADRLAMVAELPPDPGMHAEFAFHTWAAMRTERIGPFTVTPYPVDHPVEEAYALRITGPGDDGAEAVLAYSGDTDACPALDEAARAACFYLCEAAYHEGRDDAVRGVHLTGLRAGESARSAGARVLALTHLPVWNDPVRSRAEAREVFTGQVETVAAGDVFVLRGDGRVDRG